MKTTKEMIEVMLAYERGEKIECKTEGLDIWVRTDSPVWDWIHFDYRIKPKRMFIPFEKAEEFLAAQRKYSKTVRRKEDNKFFRSYVNECGDIALVDATGYSLSEDMDDIHVRYEFLDGTPCGKEVEL